MKGRLLVVLHTSDPNNPAINPFVPVCNQQEEIKKVSKAPRLTLQMVEDFFKELAKGFPQ